MIDMRYKPLFLPQVSAPVELVMEKLAEEGVSYEEIKIQPEELHPMQGIVFSDEVNDFDVENMPPMWISKDNDIVDGHHRYLKGIMNKKAVPCVRMNLNGKDSARILNKIQDIYDYEQQQKMEEVVMQDVINSDDGEISTNEFLATLESVEMPEGNGSKLVAYRQKPIVENSVVGNFFLMEPAGGYDKYEIEFENLLDTDDLGINFDNKNPIDVLAKIWFPNADFENMSAPYTHSPIDLKNKAIADRAKEMGYDGIKYGNKMIQGLK